MEGARLVGVWYNRTRLNGMIQKWKRRKGAKRGEAPTLQGVAEEKTLTLTPLPPWAELSETERRARWRALRDDVVEQHRAQDRGPSLGPEAILAEDPHHRPERAKKSPAPLVHTRVAELRDLWHAAHAAFVDGWREAMARLAQGLRPFRFPEGGILPPRAMAIAAVARRREEVAATG